MPSLDNYKVFKTDYAGRELVVEIGKYAEQANGACLVRCGDTVVNVTVCMAEKPREGMDFFPLSVDYEEKMFAVGKIPGGFKKREGRASDKAILVSRLIDRPIRPLFPKGIFNDVVVIATALSVDPDIAPEPIAMIGSSIALSVSDIPWAGPTGSVIVGCLDGKYVINPTVAEKEKSTIHLSLAGTKDAILMIEAGAKEVTDEEMVGAIMFGHEEIKKVCAFIENIQKEVGKPKRVMELYHIPEELDAAVKEYAYDKLVEALNTFDRQEREKRQAEAEADILAHFADIYPEQTREVKDSIYYITKSIVRAKIFDKGVRPDGRSLKEVRPIWCEHGILPRVHGSAVFTRGQTQALTTCTLGMLDEAQRIDGLDEEEQKRYMHQYNFPGYCTGEAKALRSPGRREIGHGALAEKALKPIIPAGDGFPFTVRVVAETLESNGSSSMAAVCGGCLSLMDAGVPISDPVAGVAMGLIKEGDNFIVLTDILGDEDALGDMDFKIAGTAEGVTAVQMDIKITGLTTEIMRKAMRQAHEARLHILGEMKKAIDGPRAELSKYAPQHAEVFVNPEVIRMIIGPGGKNIKAITAATGASVDIEDSGRISIFAPTAESMEQAKELVQYYDQRPDLGKNYMGKVRKVLEIGAIVEIMPNVEALVHISQLDTSRVAQASDVAHLGEDMLVKVIEINGDRIRASRKAVLLEEQGIEWKPEDTARPARAPRGEGDRDHRGDRGDRGERRERRPRRD